MSEYTVKLNSRVYELSNEFRELIEGRAEAAFKQNEYFECYWAIAHRDNYTDEQWEKNIHEDGDPLLVIDTVGPMVPWDDLDELEADLADMDDLLDRASDDVDDDIHEGNGIMTKPPEDYDGDELDDEIFGRTHHAQSPRRFDNVDAPQGEDEHSIPPKPERIEEDSLVAWIPRQPDVQHSWDTGEAIVETQTHTEWNVQQYANQPRPVMDTDDGHDEMEKLCRATECEVVAKYQPSDEPSGQSGQVERKGEDAYEEGRFGGGHWNV